MIEYERKAYYHETDKMGVIHHSNYLRWMEEARIYMLDSLNLSYKALEDKGIISPVVSVNVKYKSPARFADNCTVRLKLTKYTGVKFIISYEIINKDTNVLLVEAESVSCFVKDGKVISLKNESIEDHKKLLNYLESEK